MENNSIAFEFSMHDGPEVLEEIRDGLGLARASEMDSLVLRHGDHHFGDHASIHVWLTWGDVRNASLMILLAYILLGHPDWKRAELRIFAAYPREEAGERRTSLEEMIVTGRIPVSPKNVQVIPTDPGIDFDRLVEAHSGEADLVLMGFSEEKVIQRGAEVLQRRPGLHEVLWVSAREPIVIE